VAKEWTKTEAFAEFGIVCKNTRQSWSGRSLDGSVVALTFWTDRFADFKARPIVYSDIGWGADEEKVNRFGNQERAENIQWAIDHCDSVVRVIMAKAKDPSATPREQESIWPHKTLAMRITYFNPDTGEWAAASVNA
jgi:hypothetical protein